MGGAGALGDIGSLFQPKEGWNVFRAVGSAST